MPASEDSRFCLSFLVSDTLSSRLAPRSKAKKSGEWEYLLQKHDAPLDETVTDKAFFDITIGEQAAGRVVFGLFGKVRARSSLPAVWWPIVML